MHGPDGIAGRSGHALERRLHALPLARNTGEVVGCVRRQQRLYQIFKDCCDSKARRCDECVLVRAVG